MLGRQRLSMEHMSYAFLHESGLVCTSGEMGRDVPASRQCPSTGCCCRRMRSAPERRQLSDPHAGRGHMAMHVFALSLDLWCICPWQGTGVHAKPSECLDVMPSGSMLFTWFPTARVMAATDDWEPSLLSTVSMASAGKPQASSNASSTKDSGSDSATLTPASGAMPCHPQPCSCQQAAAKFKPSCACIKRSQTSPL